MSVPMVAHPNCPGLSATVIIGGRQRRQRVVYQTAWTDHCASAGTGEPLRLSEAGWMAGKPFLVLVTQTVTLSRRGKDDVCAAVVRMVDASQFRVCDQDFDERLVRDGSQQRVEASTAPPAPVGV